jgi:hypothetical protein
MSTNPQSEEHNLKVLPGAAGLDDGTFTVDYGSPQPINMYKKVEMKVEEGATCHLLDGKGGMENVDLYDQSIGMDLQCSLGDGLIIDGGGGGGSWRESTPPTGFITVPTRRSYFRHPHLFFYLTGTQTSFYHL